MSKDRNECNQQAIVYYLDIKNFSTVSLTQLLYVVLICVRHGLCHCGSRKSLIEPEVPCEAIWVLKFKQYDKLILSYI